MTTVAPGRLTPESLRRRLQAVDPRVCLVPERVLRRIIRQRALGFPLGLSVPHRKLLTATVTEALTSASAVELGLEGRPDPDAPLILMVPPEAETLANESEDQVLGQCWRRLFHAGVHLILEDERGGGRLDAVAVREQIHHVGAAAFAEAREVLQREGLLLPPADDATAFVEFAAVFLEFSAFAPALIPEYFPGIEVPEAVRRQLGVLIDVEDLQARTRPEGAAIPVLAAALPEEDIEAEPIVPPGAEAPTREAASLLGRWLALADAAEARGNLVRAAIARTRAAAQATPAQAGQARSEARRALHELSLRLATALDLDENARADWASALESLREGATHGLWPAEARILFDLQAVCVDHERPVYRVDLVEWALSWGRKPIRRLLPFQREVSERKHLGRALRRLGRASLDESEQRRLADLLHHAIERTGDRLRVLVRPRIQESLTRSGWTPENIPEQVAAETLVEQLLDGLEHRGHLAFSDLRDAISRNSLKMPDLTLPTFVARDRLLRADAQLASRLDGIYRRGELYLRALQKASSLFFGTPWGRLLVLWLILPFGGAFVTLEGLQHLINPALNFLSPPASSGRDAVAVGAIQAHDATPVPGPMAPHLHVERVHLVTAPRVLVLGFIVLVLLQSATVRGWALQGLRGLGRGLVWLFVTLPWQVAQWPPVRALLASRWFQIVRSWALEPGLITLLISGPWLAWARPGLRAWPAIVAGFALVTVLLNSRPVRLLREELIDRCRRGWRRLLHGFLPGLYRAVMAAFAHALDLVDRVLYTVDEWLRFRDGESRLSLVLKAVLGVIWFGSTYVTRLVVNLLVEPQVNPIKHFPVVTVAHKITLPFMLAVPPLLIGPPLALSPMVANGIAAAAQLLVPGVFGFLIWELKENWRLYEANRSRTLRPVLVGSHGETVGRLLRPGLHSGTLPKLFDRLRRAARQTPRDGTRRALHRAREGIRHVEHDVARFVERELVGLTRRVPGLESLGLAVHHVDVATCRIAVSLVNAGDGDRWRVVFDERGGWLVGSVEDLGGLTGLPAATRHDLERSVAGLFQKAGVTLVGEQLRRSVFPDRAESDLGRDGLRVWLPEQPDPPATFPLPDLTAPPEPPRSIGPVGFDPAPLVFARQPITWAGWVAAWAARDGSAAVADPIRTGPIFPEPASAG